MLSFIHASLEFIFNLYSCWANEKLQRIYHSYEKYRYKVNVFFWIWLWNKQSCNWVSFHFIRHHSIWLWFIFEKKLNSQWLNMISMKNLNDIPFIENYFVRVHGTHSFRFEIMEFAFRMKWYELAFWYIPPQKPNQCLNVWYRARYSRLIMCTYSFSKLWSLYKLLIIFLQSNFCH